MISGEIYVLFEETFCLSNYINSAYANIIMFKLINTTNLRS